MFNDLLLVRLYNSFNNRKDFLIVRSKQNLNFFLEDKLLLVQIPLKRYLLNNKVDWNFIVDSYDSQSEFLQVEFVGDVESYFPHGYFLLKPNFIRYIDNICYVYNFIKTTNWLFWFRPNNNFISYFLFCILKWLTIKLIVNPFLVFKSALKAGRIWAKLVLYWFSLFSLFSILNKLHVLGIINNMIINIGLNILSWRGISLFIWVIPTSVPTLIKWLGSLQAYKTDIKTRGNVPLWSLKRLNKISDNEVLPTPTSFNKIIKPSHDIDLTSSTDLEDGLVVIGEVSELGFQEITHWIDWTTGLTTVTVFTVSALTIRAIAGRRFKK